MATDTVAPKLTTMADLKGKVDPDWCPGCGDFGVLAAVQKALVELQIPNHDVATISGIGCSSNFPGLHQHLRHAHPAWALARRGHGLQDGEPRHDGAGHRRRRRRLRHRRQSLHAHHAPQRRSALHRHGQPDLRPHHRSNLAHQPPGHEDQEHALWQRRRADQSHFARAVGGSHVHRAWLQRAIRSTLPT